MKSALLLASRYAQAFLRVYDIKLTKDDITQLENIIETLERQKPALFLADINMIESKDQFSWVKSLLKNSNIASSLYELINLLIHHKRMRLFSSVIKEIIKYYLRDHNIHQAIVKSFPLLSSENKQTIEKFLNNRYGSSVLISYRLDPKLIAGISIKTNDEVWQYSCAQQLNEMRTALMR